jgi:hypothetical protein
MHKIVKLLDEMALHVPNADKLNPRISTVDVGWHIHHSILVITEIIKSVAASDPKQYQSKFNLKKIVVFSLGKFPRGKAPAPAAVKPNNSIDSEQLISLFTAAKNALGQLKEAQKNQYFIHPIFGKLNVKDTWKMLTIHTQHHLLIINDIIKS